MIGLCSREYPVSGIDSIRPASYIWHSLTLNRIKKMTKQLLLLLLAGGIFLTAPAQVQFGVKAGPSLYSLTGSDASGAKLLFGFHAGAFVKLPFSDQFSLQPEVQYSMQGAKGTDNYTNYDFTDHNNYINVPLLFTFTHSSGLILQTGPQLSFLMSSKETENGVTADTKKAFKSFDAGWATGIGYVSPANIGFIFRYSAGWLNIENKDYTSGTGSQRNLGFQLSIFYLFGGSDDRY